MKLGLRLGVFRETVLYFIIIIIGSIALGGPWPPLEVS
jgi:hypothetical protein